MQFKKGNSLWKSRSKHGRGYLFKTPEALWDAACEYFQWCDDTPAYKTIYCRDAEEHYVRIPITHAYTLKGLYAHLNCGDRYFHHFEKQLKDKTDEISEE